MLIQLDASEWLTPRDFYRALLAELGAPEWHGWSIDALIDSMIFGGINSVVPPYRLIVTGLSKAREDAASELSQAFAALAQHPNRAHVAGDMAWLEIV
ncbi:barstar family protein [Rhizorhabdus sp.]|uniref:barstar family protein n=1 Tax=Rhizorhabdus sp. TaxID=1968843 RepID=UPI0035AEC8CE